MNNKSIYFKDWTTKKLVGELKLLQFLVFDEECYGVSDLLEMLGVSRELNRRGYEEDKGKGKRGKETYTRKEVWEILEEIRGELRDKYRERYIEALRYSQSLKGLTDEDINVYFDNYEL